ncbi:MAG TPA: choice-of-anchor tandem repeat GloVer-containing protein [Rhizomicrobium sp.]|jgi:uncharacterized repeat protein (TIGR03803 family)|nr:choice-of-anchor tandem repeat GloVer-containing protein [Rhizomicrobium sp.]
MLGKLNSAALCVLAGVVASAASLPPCPAKASVFKVIHAFRGGGDGAYPGAGVTFDQAGAMYGTTEGGGPQNAGTVFTIAPNGEESVVYAFKGGRDGSDPTAPLLMTGSGTVYGVTSEGGGTGCGGNGCGTVFKLSPDGRETVLYLFQGGSSDGAFPLGGLIADQQGNLFGTTANGGIDGCSDYNGCGTIFKLAPDGTETVIYRFTGGDDGGLPLSGLVADRNFNLFGTTGMGGAHTLGVVYKLVGGRQQKVLHAFDGQDGAFPSSSLILDTSGDLYGTTSAGGNQGVVFKLAPDGTETLLHSFTGVDGASPSAGLVVEGKLNLYGTTSGGGADRKACGGTCGVVFRLAPDGDETLLHRFKGGRDGFNPRDGLSAAPSGNLVGTAEAGGRYGYGAVFIIGK